MTPKGFLMSKYQYMIPELEVIEEAKLATCCRSKCGSIIVPSGIYPIGPYIIGRGHNSMPCNVEGSCFKDDLPSDFKSDKTCCVHAEQRAIMNALATNASYVPGSTLFFIRLDENDQPKVSGDPYCTICSKMTLDVGIKYFCLYRSNGWVAYETEYYNWLSYQYKNI